MTFLIDLALRGAVVLAAAGLATLALRRAPAAMRHLVWALAAVSLLLVPALPAVLPGVPVPVLPAPAAIETSEPAPVFPIAPLAATLPPPSESTIPAESTPAVVAHDAEPTPPPPRGMTIPWLLITWTIGLLAALTPWVLGTVRFLRIARRAEPFRGWTPKGSTKILVADDVPCPLAGGILRPYVLLPREALGWSAARLRPVLLHEMAHVRRRDCLTEALARLGVAVHWFNPLAWLALKGLRAESEQACDDQVLAAGQQATDYADCLLTIARGAKAHALLGMANGSRLERRLRAILDTTRRRRPLARRITIAAFVTAILFVGVLSALQPEEIAAEEQATTITVGKVGDADYRSLAEAIAAAEPGTAIRIGPGTWEGPFEITKALTLRGAGPDRTILTSKLPETLDPAHPSANTLVVTDCKTVVVENLGLRLEGPNPQGIAAFWSALLFRRATGIVTRCAVVGSPGNGITVGHESSVRIERTLVAAVWATGIAVGEPKDHKAHAEILDCDVRRCHHRGITIAPGNDSTIVKGCRISGSAWHGIRYDHASPTIEGNRIFRNERSGIYANGKTRAKVRENVFLENGMTGMSCWYQSADVIEGNTFSGNRRSGLEILDASSPVVTGNVFAGSPTGIGRGFTSTVDTIEKGRPVFKNNVFSGNDRDYARPVDGKLVEAELPGEGNRRGEVLKVPDLPKSDWPDRTEEQRVPAPKIPDPVSAKKKPMAPWQVAKPWVDDLLQISDAEKRAAALEVVRQALASDDPHLNHAGLVAFQGTHEVAYDKAPFRSLVLPLVTKLNGAAQVMAFYALRATGKQEGDLDLVLDALEDPSDEMREAGSHLILGQSKGVITGRSAEAILRLLQSENGNHLREVFRGLWGAKTSDAIQARAVEIAGAPGSASHGDAVYFFLSTQNNKTEAVVRKLIEAVETGHSTGRALWGLSYGVRPECRTIVADAILEVLKARGNAYTRKECIDIIEEYGGPTHREVLREFAKNAMLDEPTKKRLRKAIDSMRPREKPSRKPKRSPYTLSKPWIRDAMQLRDAEKRKAAIERIRAAFTSDDPDEVSAAFLAFSGISALQFDKASFREVILPHVLKAEGGWQYGAFSALAQTGPVASDLELVFAALDDPNPDMRRRGSGLVVMFSGDRLGEKAVNTILRFLDTDDEQVLESVIGHLWGAPSSPKIVDRLLALAENKEGRLYKKVITTAFSTFKNKSPELAEALIEAAGNPDYHIGSRAVLGLSNDVAPVARPAAADCLLTAFETRAGDHLRRFALEGLARYGGARHMARLQEILKEGILAEDAAAAVRGTVLAILKR